MDCAKPDSFGAGSGGLCHAVAVGPPAELAHSPENWLWSPGAPPLLPVPIITPLLSHYRPGIEALDSGDLGSVLARLPF